MPAPIFQTSSSCEKSEHERCWSRLPARPSPEALQLYVLEGARSLRLVMAIRKMHPPFFFLCDAVQCTSYHVWDRSHEIVSIQRLLFLAASVIVLSCARKRRLLYIQHSIFLDGFYRSNCLYTCDFFIDLGSCKYICIKL